MAWIDFGRSNKRLSLHPGRLVAPDNSGNWLRINRDQADSKMRNFLDAGQLMEEKLIAVAMKSGLIVKQTRLN